jgi:hypothetical protein
MKKPIVALPHMAMNTTRELMGSCMVGLRLKSRRPAQQKRQPRRSSATAP